MSLNMLKMFDVEITKHINYKNYVAKNAVVDNRIFKNGNRLFFLEPMESSASQAYISWVRMSFDYIFNDKDFNPSEAVIKHINNYKILFCGTINMDQNMILHFGIMQKLLLLMIHDLMR